MIKVVTLDKRVSCLPGYENFDTRAISRRLPKRKALKSSKELRWEKEAREGKINLLANAS